MEKEKGIRAVSGPEQDFVGRALLDWFNEYTQFPDRVSRIESEYLPAKNGMGLFATQAAYKTREYISGAYEAQYQFSIQYRTAPSTSNQRLSAAEALSDLASWAEQREQLPDLGPGKRAVSVERTSPAVMLARYEDGSEDYQILMVMDYEVRPAQKKGFNNHGREKKRTKNIY